MIAGSAGMAAAAPLSSAHPGAPAAATGVNPGGPIHLAAYGRDELWKAIGPGHDEAWQYGYISGKLATLRWVLGSEWDFLDT